MKKRQFHFVCFALSSIMTFAAILHAGETDNAKRLFEIRLQGGSAITIPASEIDSMKVAKRGEIKNPHGMRLIPARHSSFLMGRDQEGPIVSNSRPVEVFFTCDFWMDTFPVTCGEYSNLMKEFYADYSNPFDLEAADSVSETMAGGISWCDAALYCNARSKRDGYDTVYLYTQLSGFPGDGCTGDMIADLNKGGYRLPTEAEWEYAHRGGTSSKYFWGDEPAPHASEHVHHPPFSVFRVGQKPPNPFGLYDMWAGHWCNDIYDEKSHWMAERFVDPTGPLKTAYRKQRAARGPYPTYRVGLDDHYKESPLLVRCVLPAK